MAANSISRHSSLAPLLVICGLGALALDARAGRLDGSAPDPDVLAAVALVRTHAEAGDDVAQLTLGEYLFHAGSRSDAVDWYLRAAAVGHPAAQFRVGELYYFGTGVPQDDGAALAWYRRAADRGHPAAQRRVGDFHRAGVGVEVNVLAAIRWYRRAADGDDIRAQYALGDLYLNGLGVEADPAEAYVWFTLAASQAPLVDNWKALIELRNIAAARIEPAEREGADRRIEGWRPAIWSARDASRRD